jgi:hypothetical protein
MLDEYIKELEEDLKINELNLKDYQLKLPAIKHKWAGRYITLKMEIVQDNKKLDKTKKALTEEIEKASPVKLTTVSINQIIESHSVYKDFKSKIEEKKLVIELLEKTEKTLSSTTYDIKNLVEIMKLEMT